MRRTFNSSIKVWLDLSSLEVLLLSIIGRRSGFLPDTGLASFHYKKKFVQIDVFDKIQAEDCNPDAHPVKLISDTHN